VCRDASQLPQPPLTPRPPHPLCAAISGLFLSGDLASTPSQLRPVCVSIAWVFRDKWSHQVRISLDHLPLKIPLLTAEQCSMSTQCNDEMVLADALSALGELPLDVTATSALRGFRLHIVDLADGMLAAECIDKRPAVGTELVIRTTSDRRAAYDIECVVSHGRSRRLKLDVRSLSRLPGRRRGTRAAIHELFLIYGDSELDGDVTNISQDGMRFRCTRSMDVGSEVRGMLNIHGRVFPVAAEVRHTTKRAGRYEVGVRFRHLRPEEHALFAQLTAAEELGRRQSEGTATLPQAQDIRDRLRRWTA
jgi:hypothetical protein